MTRDQVSEDTLIGYFEQAMRNVYNAVEDGNRVLAANGNQAQIEAAFAKIAAAERQQSQAYEKLQDHRRIPR